jgi:hypothetical protein
MEGAEEAATKAQAGYALTLGPPRPKPRPASGYYGVGASGKRWASHIYNGGKKHRLGSFGTKQEAALAYDREARQCGKDKHLNYESMEGAEEAATKAQAEHALTLEEVPNAQPDFGHGMSTAQLLAQLPRMAVNPEGPSRTKWLREHKDVLAALRRRNVREPFKNGIYKLCTKAGKKDGQQVQQWYGWSRDAPIMVAHPARSMRGKMQLQLTYV